jgi:hypothetical protein
MSDLHSADAAAANLPKLTDPRVAELAEALATIPLRRWEAFDVDDLAAAILAALPPGRCGHPTATMLEREAEAHEAEIARLRNIKEAARRLSGHEAGCRWNDLSYGRPHHCDCGYDALRAALEEER